MKNNSFLSLSKASYIFIFLLCGLSTNLSGQDTPIDVRGQDRIPHIKASVKVTNSCNSGKSCGTWLASMKKVNAIEITNQSYTWYPSLVFEIYDCPNNTCNLVDTFVCSDQVVTFASSKLTNGAQALVKLKDTQSNNAAMYTFTNGSFNGQICGNGGSPVIK